MGAREALPGLIPVPGAGARLEYAIKRPRNRRKIAKLLTESLPDFP